MRDDPAVTDWIERAKSANILDVAREMQPKLRRAGADWNGPCPAGCGKVAGDGFVITPAKGIFLCRPSGTSGGIVDMVMHARGETFVQAVEFITHETKPGGARAETDESRAKREREQNERRAESAARQEAERKAAESDREREQRDVVNLQERARRITGTHAEAYLRARLIQAPANLLKDVLFIPDLQYWGYAAVDAQKKTLLATLPAMVARIRNVDNAVIGMHRTYLDPVKPEKWSPPIPARNKAKKVVGDTKGGMIRLGRVEPTIAIAEGIETALSWFALGLGPSDISLASAVSLGNLSGKCTGTFRYKDKQGSYPNGIPAEDDSGVLLPEGVTEVFIIGDGDSDALATEGRILAALRRWRAQGRTVHVHMAPAGADFNDVLIDQESDRAA